jgi:hypothetical protein
MATLGTRLKVIVHLILILTIFYFLPAPLFIYIFFISPHVTTTALCIRVTKLFL